MLIPAVTVIIPVFNTEQFLRKCLNSVLNQSFSNIEIIIINDCSPDNSQSIIDEFKNNDSRIKAIQLPTNQGLSAVRNIGIQNASSEYILHLDSDDWIDPMYIETLIHTAKLHNSDLVITDYFITYPEYHIYFSDQTKEDKILDNYECIKNISNGTASPCVWAKLIKKDLYLQHNISHPETISLGEDLAVMLKLMFYAKNIYKVNKAFVHYTQNDNSITHKITNEKLFEIEKVVDINCDFFSQHGLEELSNSLQANILNFWLFSVPYSKDPHYLRILNRYLNVIKSLTPEYCKARNIRFLKHFPMTFSFYLLYKFQNVKIITIKTLKKILPKKLRHFLRILSKMIFFITY